MTQAFSGAIDGIGGNKFSSAYFEAGNRAARIVAAAVVGGTTSVMSGGKFANGAITGAFSRAFNDDAHQERISDYKNKMIGALKQESKWIASIAKLTDEEITAYFPGFKGDKQIMLAKLQSQIQKNIFTLTSQCVMETIGGYPADTSGALFSEALSAKERVFRILCHLGWLNVKNVIQPTLKINGQLR